MLFNNTFHVLTASVAHFDVIFIENLVVFILYQEVLFDKIVETLSNVGSLAYIVSNNIYSPIFTLPLGFSRSRITVGQFLGIATGLQSFLIPSFTSITDLFVTPCFTESMVNIIWQVFQDGRHGLS